MTTAPLPVTLLPLTIGTRLESFFFSAENAYAGLRNAILILDDCHPKLIALGKGKKRDGIEEIEGWWATTENTARGIYSCTE